jgi:putative hydrolase of the HAD superfamily
MEQTLLSLRKSGARLGIVTNGETHLQLRSILALGLDRLVDTYLISESEGCRKPDAEIFSRAAERLRVGPQDCAFVGDTPQTDMIGARQVGMRTIWFPNGLTWPNAFGWQPDAEISQLSELPPVLRRLQPAPKVGAQHRKSTACAEKTAARRSETQDR